MGLRQRGSVIGNYVTASNTSASGMWTGKEAYTLQKKGTWQLPPTFSISAGAANVNEGASVNFTMTTTGVPNGAIIPYIASGANITILDSANSSLSGNFVIQNGSNTISFSANLDLTTEGSEVLQITAAGATASVTINDTSTTPVSLDAQFPYTTLLLNGEGTNNSQNNTFLDSSTNNFSITRNGNSTQGTFSPYGGNWSTSFSDSAGDYLEISSSTAFALGTGDFTIEAWIYPFSYGGSVAGSAIFGTSAGAGTGYSLNLGESQDRMRILSNASGTWADNLVVSAGGGAPLHTWSHIAWVRSGNSMSIYKNGVSVATMSGVSGYNFTSPSNKGFIGFWWDGGTTRYFNGYISNLRVVKGTALYATTFTPSTTPLTAVANTQLLTCADNRFIDDSPNNFTITRYIAPKIQRFSPFSPVITTPTTYSGYFDGTGDYLSLATNAAFNITSGSTDSFICEFWVYFSSVAASTSLVDNGGLSGATFANWHISLNASSQFGIVWGNEGSQQGILASSTVPVVGQWYHIALVKTNADWALFINGARGISYNGINTASKSSATALYIGYGLTTSAGGNGFNGVISNVRIYKGATASAPYLATSTTITVPTSPLTSITNTSLLTCQSPTFIDNSTNAFAITATGNPTPTTVNPFGFTNTASEYSTTTFGGSVYFDGTGDVLIGPTSNTVFQLTTNGGTGLTVEAWIYPTNVTGSKLIASYYNYNDGGAEQGWYFRVIDGQLQAGNANGGTSRSGGSIPVNTWTHVAFVINSGSFYLYVNGVSVGSVTGVGTQNYDSTTLVIGGIKQNGSYTNQVFNGYISNLRTTNTAVYTGAFTPTTTPLTAVANTTMLCNFTNAGIIDNAMMNNLETLGDAKISTTQSKFGGTSMYFDGTGDYLYVPSNINNALGTGDFTLECWVNATSIPSDVGIFESRTNGIGATANGFTLTAFSSSVIRIYSNGVLISSTGTTYVGTWCHVAVVRSSGIWNLYINGVSQGTNSASRDLTNTDAVIGAGRYASDSTPNAFFPGYIDDFRITKGYARYTSTFTPPTNQLAGK
jgi:hypothetical protein